MMMMGCEVSLRVGHGSDAVKEGGTRGKDRTGENLTGWGRSLCILYIEQLLTIVCETGRDRVRYSVYGTYSEL